MADNISNERWHQEGKTEDYRRPDQAGHIAGSLVNSHDLINNRRKARELEIDYGSLKHIKQEQKDQYLLVRLPGERDGFKCYGKNVLITFHRALNCDKEITKVMGVIHALKP